MVARRAESQRSSRAHIIAGRRLLPSARARGTEQRLAAVGSLICSCSSHGTRAACAGRGRRIGLGDWRPEKSGVFGRFDVEDVILAMAV